MVQGEEGMLGADAAVRVEDEWARIVALAPEPALHGFDQMDVLLDGGGAVLDGEPPDDLAVDSVRRVPAAPDRDVIDVDRPPEIGVQDIARIDLEGEGRPEIPG